MFSTRTPAFVISVALLSAWSFSSVAGGLSRQLILSSAWCSFSYNQSSGRSASTRIRFNADGSFGTGLRAEMVSSGANGSVASQNNGSGGGYWKVEGGELFMSDGGPLQAVQTMLKRNSNGYPVIVGDGVEYSQCN